MEDNTPTGNVSNGNRPDTRRFEEEDNSGHQKGSRQHGSSADKTEKYREAEDNENSELNKLDDRGTLGGNEAI